MVPASRRTLRRLLDGVWLCALPAAVLAQPVPLDDEALAGLTAATGAADRATLEAGPGRTAATDTGHRTYGRAGANLVVDAEATRDARRTVRLEAGAQTGARGLNVVNAAGADVAQGVNVAELQMTGDAAFVAAQRNAAEQTDTSGTSLASLTAGVTLEQTRRASLRATSSRVSGRLAEGIDRSVSVQRTTTRFEATVEPEEIGLFDEAPLIDGTTVTFTDAVEIDFGSIPVEFTIGEDFPTDLFDVDIDTTIDVPRLSVSDITFSTGRIELDGSDIVLTAPSLTIPEVTFSYCFLDADDCTSEDDDKNYTTLTIPGRTIGLENEIRLEDANPLGDYGFSFGYAVSGDGSVSFDAGGITVDGAFPIDVDRLGDLDFSLDVPHVDEIFTGLGGALNPPPFDIGVNETFEFPQPDAYERQFSSEACTYTQGQQTCTPIDTTTEEQRHTERRTSDTHRTEISADSTHERVEIERRRGTIAVHDAEAERLVLRESSLADTEYDLVIVGDGAQNRMRAVNAVNGAGAIVGNGLNAVSAPSAAPAAGRDSRLSQSNAFEQIGGL